MVDSDSDDDSLLNGQAVFSRPKRSCRANPEEKQKQDGFARIQKAMEMSARKIQNDDQIRRVKQEMSHVTDEDGDKNLAKVENRDKVASSKKAKIDKDAWMVAAEDNDGEVPIKVLIARASAINTYGACRFGTIEVFNYSADADNHLKADPIELLKICLQRIESKHKPKSPVHNDIVLPLRKALKTTFVACLLKSGYFDRHCPPLELVRWLYQVALCEPCRGPENEEICERAFTVITKFWKNPQQNATLTMCLLNIVQLVPLLEQVTTGIFVSSKLAKFFQIWEVTLRGGGVGMNPDDNLAEIVQSNIVALVRVGLDNMFHDHGARSLLTHLQELLCALVDLACPDGQCDDDWMKQTAQQALRDENLAPGNKAVDDEDEDANANTKCLTVMLAAEIIPFQSSDHRAHKSCARLKAFTAMRALEIILGVSDWEGKVQEILKASTETNELADKATKSMSWLTFASALAAVKELLDNSGNFARDGPLLVSVLHIITMCWHTAPALTSDNNDKEAMISMLPLFEPHFLALSQVALSSKLDPHFRSAEQMLDLLRRLCQTIRARSVTPIPVQVQKTMFDFLTISPSPTDGTTSPHPPTTSDSAPNSIPPTGPI